MELKHTNFNSEIVQAKDLHLIRLSFEKLWKLNSKINPLSYFFKKIDAKIAKKTRLSITFTSVLQMEWFNDYHVIKNVV